MVAYFILTQTVTDVERYRAEYIPRVRPILVKHNAKVIVSTLDAEPLEGNPAKGVVVLRFESEQAARDFEDDPEYRPVKELRFALTTDANAVLAPEFQMPAG